MSGTVKLTREEVLAILQEHADALFDGAKVVTYNTQEMPDFSLEYDWEME